LSASAQAPPGSNLLPRLATAAVALPLLGSALFLGPPALTLAIVAAAILLGLSEFFALMTARGLVAPRLATLILLAGVFCDVLLPRAFPLWPAAIVLFLVLALAAGAEPSESVPGTAAALLGAVLLGGLGAMIGALRVQEPDAGAWRVTLLLGIVMGSDTLAYFVGRAIGRHKLSPRISPGKTVEGAIGGVAGGVLGAWVVRNLGLPGLPIAHAVGLGALGAGLGMAGDLFESLLKRWAGVKDSGWLFPGHGGMLDRLDSLLFAAPVLYYYFSCCAR
jgi:phosphatidate cytidylyltransferase